MQGHSGATAWTSLPSSVHNTPSPKDATCVPASATTQHLELPRGGHTSNSHDSILGRRRWPLWLCRTKMSLVSVPRGTQRAGGPGGDGNLDRWLRDLAPKGCPKAPEVPAAFVWCPQRTNRNPPPATLDLKGTGEGQARVRGSQCPSVMCPGEEALLSEFTEHTPW